MTDRLPAPVRKVGDTFKSFTPGQKAVTIFAVLALAIGGYFFATWAAKPAYAPLFSNLSSKDASAIVESLQGSGTAYELANGGQTILVPQEQVYDLRLQLSGEGLPGESDTGYALLDQQGITTSDFMQHTNYQRALEGELASTIKSIDGVEAAMAKAQELAGGRTVEVAAGDVGGQVLAAGLVDEVAMDVAPVVLGSGKRYFGSVDAQHLLEDPDVVIQGNRVLHLRYRVRR